MVKVTDAELLLHADRIKDKVLLITGAGSGIGRAIVLMYARYGAKIVIGDINAAAAQAVADEIKQAGGHAVSQHCDVTQWNDQVALFDLAIATYGSVDVVIPNAGLVDRPIWPLQRVDGKLQPPALECVQVNYISVFHTCALALHYLVSETEQLPPDALKALILIGSMSAFHPLYGGVQYTSSKHAVLGLQRSISPVCTAKGIRSGSVHPWFVDTAMTSHLTALLQGLPLVDVTRVAATCLAVATNPDPETTGRQWLLPDGDGEEVERLQNFELNEGIYKTLNTRLKSLVEGAKLFKH